MLKLYNTLTKKKEIFRPLKKGEVKLYNCGLTVYDYAHIGNLRAFTFADILRRYLEYKGYRVRQVMNFTDVGHMFEDVDIGEDKMEAAAKREKKDPWSLADFYIREFTKDSEEMSFLEPLVRPRATDHIDEMILLVKKLIERGYAYVVNGSVYFDVAKFKAYGKLSGNTLERLKAGAGGRVEFNPDKRSQFDFALWINDPKHTMSWKSPWCGKGYPGWHLECSTMAMKYLGETIDIHTGGVDNLFPHHENEIAQSEAATDRQFVRYWLHNEHLLVDGGRMGKSLGNKYTLRDLVSMGHDPKALRYLLLATHYRQQMSFTFEGLEAARTSIDRLRNLMARLAEADGEGSHPKTEQLMRNAQTRFEEAMDDDLNISIALAALFSFAHEVNRMLDVGMISKSEADGIRTLIMRFDKVLAVIGGAEEGAELPLEAQKMISKREEARKAKEWEEADRLRVQLRTRWSVVVEDTPKGPRWRIERKPTS